MQMDMTELLRKEDKFEKLTSVLNGLDASLSQPSQKSSGAAFVNNVEEIERIVVNANENSIRITSSGSYTSLTVMIYDFGMQLNSGLGGGSELISIRQMDTTARKTGSLIASEHTQQVIFL